MNTKDYMYNENEFYMNFKVFYPDAYDDLPLIVYLHGAGERGKNNKMIIWSFAAFRNYPTIYFLLIIKDINIIFIQNISHLYRHGIPKLIEEGLEVPAVVLAPQCPEWCVWDNIPDKVKGIIDCVVKEFGIKKDRICITGSSMGGFGTWMMGKTYPSFFAGIAPVAGGGMSWRTTKLCSTPVLAIHGTADDGVPIIYSQLMVEGVNKNGGSAELIELEGYGHNDGIDYAYRNTKLINWLTQQRRTNFEYVKEFCEELF